MVDVGDIISTGFNRTFKRNALVLVGLTFLINVFSSVIGQSFMSRVISSLSSLPATNTSQQVLALNIPVAVSGPLYLVALIASAVVGIGTIRTLVSSETEKLPREYFTEDLLMTLLNLLGGGIVFAVVLGLAYGLPVLPGYAAYLAGIQLPAVILMILGGLASLVIGTYVFTSLFFWNFYVIVDRQNLIDAMRSSWNDTEGDRLELFGAGAIVGIVTVFTAGLLGFILGIIGVLTGTLAATTIINMLPQALVSVFTLAAAAEAYRQIS